MIVLLACKAVDAVGPDLDGLQLQEAHQRTQELAEVRDLAAAGQLHGQRPAAAVSPLESYKLDWVTSNIAPPVMHM